LPAEDTQGLVEGLDWEIGIEAVEGGAEAGLEEDLIEGGALFVDRVGIEVFVIEDLVAQVGEPGQGSLLEIGLARVRHERLLRVRSEGGGGEGFGVFDAEFAGDKLG
jgi:hypothetical protein